MSTTVTYNTQVLWYHQADNLQHFCIEKYISHNGSYTFILVWRVSYLTYTLIQDLGNMIWHLVFCQKANFLLFLTFGATHFLITSMACSFSSLVLLLSKKTQIQKWFKTHSVSALTLTITERTHTLFCYYLQLLQCGYWCHIPKFSDIFKLKISHISSQNVITAFSDEVGLGNCSISALRVHFHNTCFYSGTLLSLEATTP